MIPGFYSWILWQLWSSEGFRKLVLESDQYGGLDRRLLECLIVRSCSQVRVQPQKLTFQVCSQTSKLHMNASCHIIDELMMSSV